MAGSERVRELPTVVIPAYQPEQPLLDLVRNLLDRGYPAILVTDDGSDLECRPIFDALAAMEEVTVLRHAVNLGKGQALKTAFDHFLSSANGGPGVITADADGQHRADDVNRVAESFSRAPERLHMGVRKFVGKVPLRSRFGNTATRHVFRLVVGKALTDTQSGLRAIPATFLPRLLRSASTGFDFELEMLLIACHEGMEIETVPIATVYEDGNRSSHFKPIRDSLEIYSVFLRFFTSRSSFS